MMKILATIAFIFLFALSANAQKVEVEQSFVDDAAKCFDEVVKLRATVAQFLEKERAAGERERASAKLLLDSLDVLISVKNQTIAQYADLVKFQQQIIEFQQMMLTKFQEMITKPKSFWRQVWNGIKKVVEVIITYLVLKGVTSRNWIEDFDGINFQSRRLRADNQLSIENKGKVGREIFLFGKG